MKRKIVLFSSIIIPLSIGTLVGCSNSKGNISIDANDQQYVEEFNNNYDGPNDSNIVIDGKLDEASWQNKKWQRNTFINNNGLMPYTYTTAFTTDYGVYIGCKVDDKNITYTGEYAPAISSCYEIYFWVQSKFEETHVDGDWTNVKVLTTDIGGTGHGNIFKLRRAVTVDGVINSGETNHAYFEFFIPWEEMNKERFKNPDTNQYEYPSEVHLIGQYRASLVTGASNSLMSFSNTSLHHHTTYFLFNENGFINEDRDNAIIGDTPNGYPKTANWIIDKEKDGEVSIKDGVENEAIFFTKANDENFVMNATIYPTNRLSGITDATANRYGGHYAGLNMMNSNGGNYGVLFVFDDNNMTGNPMDENRNIIDIKLMTLSTINGWKQNNIFEIKNVNRPNTSGIDLKVIKFGKQLHYFIDGEYACSEYADSISGRVFAGFFTLNMGVIYRNYNYKAYSYDEAVSALNKEGIYQIYLEDDEGLDVELSTSYTTTSSSVTVSTTLAPGYTFKKVSLNDIDIIENFLSNIEEGKYLLEGINKNSELIFETEEVSNYSLFTGNIEYSERTTEADLVLVGDNGLKYSYETDSSGAFNLKLLKGEYDLDILIVEEVPYRTHIDLNTSITDVTYEIPQSGFAYDENDSTINFLYNYQNHKVEYKTLETRKGFSGIDFAERLPKSFMMEVDMSTLDTAWPCAGISIGNDSTTIEIYLGDTSTLRVMKNRQWALIHDERCKAFTIDGDRRGVGKLTITCDGELLHIFVDNRYVYSLELDDFGLENLKEYKVGLAAWDVTINSGVITPRGPMITFDSWNVNTNASEISEYLELNYEPIVELYNEANKVGLIYDRNLKYDSNTKTISATYNDFEFQEILCDGQDEEVYLKTQVYSSDLDGITIEADNGANVQLSFQNKGFVTLTNYSWDRTAKMKREGRSEYYYNNHSLTDVSHLWGEEIEFAISDNVLYTTIDGVALFSIDLSELHDDFVEGTGYTIGFYSKAPHNDPIVDGKLGADTKFVVADNFFAYGSDATASINAVKAKF